MSVKRKISINDSKTCYDLRMRSDANTLYDLLKENTEYNEDQIIILVDYVFNTPVEELIEEDKNEVTFKDICRKLV